MTILSLAIVLIIVGVLLYAVNVLIPMEARIKTVLNIVVLLGVGLWLLDAFGLVNTGIRLR